MFEKGGLSNSQKMSDDTYIGKHFSQRFHFKANRKSIGSSKNGTKDYRNCFPFEISIFFNVTITENFERFQYVKFQKKISEKWKKWKPLFR